MQDAHMPRGYCAIGILGCKTELNIGGLWRSAHAFGCAYIFCIAPRFHPIHRRQASDTTHAAANIPYYCYGTLEEFLAARPHGAALIAVEQAPSAQPLETFVHPRCATYLLGAEDTGISEKILQRCNSVISINTPVCLNVATAGSIVLYDREAKRFGTRDTSQSRGEERCPIPKHAQTVRAQRARITINQTKMPCVAHGVTLTA